MRIVPLAQVTSHLVGDAVTRNRILRILPPLVGRNCGLRCKTTPSEVRLLG